MMLNIGSPHFSTCSKAELLSRLSPSFRNKRVPSAQDNYSQSNGNLHKNSLRKQSSPSKLSQKSKRSRSRKATSTSNCVNKTIDGTIMAEVSYLKEEYQSLKNAYHGLIQQKIKSAQTLNSLKEQSVQLKSENERLKRESEKSKSKICFLELEIQRIKRQCMKLVQLQQFKSKRLQENLKEKEETIRALMTISEQLVQKPQLFERIKSLVTHQSKNINEQSLMVSQDKPFSIHNRNQSQFISISLTSMMEDDRTVDIYTKKPLQNNKQNKNSDNLKKSRGQQKKILGQRIFYTEGQNIEQEHENMRKIRKQLNKKLQINVDERTKDYMCNPLKTPVSNNDRKNSKLKNSKSKSKKSDDDQSTRFLKKKHK